MSEVTSDSGFGFRIYALEADKDGRETIEEEILYFPDYDIMRELPDTYCENGFVYHKWRHDIYTANGSHWNIREG